MGAHGTRAEPGGRPVGAVGVLPNVCSRRCCSFRELFSAPSGFSTCVFTLTFQQISGPVTFSLLSGCCCYLLLCFVICLISSSVFHSLNFSETDLLTEFSVVWLRYTSAAPGNCGASWRRCPRPSARRALSDTAMA